MKCIKNKLCTVMSCLFIATFFLPSATNAASFDFNRIYVKSIENDVVTISWYTTEPAQGWLQIGTKQNEYDLTIGANQYQTVQEVSWTLPKEDTTYHYRILAENYNGQRITSFDFNFEVKKFTDNQPPEFLERPRIFYLGGTEAFIGWQTDKKTSGLIKYSTESDMSSAKSVRANRLEDNYMRARITGLQERVTYYYEITITDEQNNSIYTSVKSFTTNYADTSELKFLQLQPLGETSNFITDSTLTVKAETSRPSLCQLTYSAQGHGTKQIKETGLEIYQHEMIASGLEPGTPYKYTLTCKDVLNKQITTDDIAFTTLEPKVLGYEYNGDPGSLTAVEHGPIFYASYNTSTAPDSAVGSHKFTNYGAPQINSASGKSGGSVLLNGSASIAYEGNSNFNIGAGTVSFWFKPLWDNTTDIEHILFDLNPNYENSSDKYFSLGQFYQKGATNQNFSFVFEDAKDNDFQYNINLTNLKINDWNHLVFAWQFSSQEVHIYLNGYDVTPQHTGYRLGAAPQLGQTFYIGSGAGKGTNSYIDELQIYDYVLNEGQILRLMNDVTPNLSLPATNTTSATTAVSGPQSQTYTQATSLLKTANSPDIWAIINGHRHYISGPTAFAHYGYSWSQVRTVSVAELNAYPIARLVRSPEDATIYYLYQRPNNRWLKIAIPSPTVFVSYAGNYWGNVAVVDQLDINAYPSATLIKGDNDATVYLLDNGVKRPIYSSQTFEQKHYSWSDIVQVNTIHLQSYYTGSPLL